jgi:hypothetical protein
MSGDPIPTPTSSSLDNKRRRLLPSTPVPTPHVLVQNLPSLSLLRLRQLVPVPPPLVRLAAGGGLFAQEAPPNAIAPSDFLFLPKPATFSWSPLTPPRVVAGADGRWS